MFYLTLPKRQALLALILLLFSPLILAQTSLFNKISTSELSSIKLPANADAAQLVKINPQALQDKKILIDLFGKTVLAVRQRVEQNKTGQHIWIGHILGNPADRVIIAHNNGIYSGLIRYKRDAYRIGFSDLNNSMLIKLNVSQFPPIDVDPLLDGGGTAVPYAKQSLTGGDNIVQDLLMVYTQQACDKAGGCDALETDIMTAVANINAAYIESGINITMNLVGSRIVQYTGTSLSDAISRLRNPSDGYMDEVHTHRDELGADLVSMIIHLSDGFCGIAYYNVSEYSAFSVLAEGCLLGTQTLAHEIGHNQGSHHDRTTYGQGVDGEYNFGYRRCNDGSVDDFGAPYFHTIMAYPCSGAGQIGRFSNPNLSFAGVPQGIDPAVDPSRAAWAARTINESAARVAAFRTTVINVPNAPNGLNALASGTDKINLTWVDNSFNEDRFVVQSSADANNWSDIATVGVDTITYEDNGLSPNTTYYYRVRAENSAGSSDYSNVSSATTDPHLNTVVNYAIKDIFKKGSVRGSYQDTHTSGPLQIITEEPKSIRKPKQFYRHIWKFNISGGENGVVFSIDAWVSGSEGAKLSYRTQNSKWLPMMTVVNNKSVGLQRFSLPDDVSRVVKVRVVDAERVRGEAIDSVIINYMDITSFGNRK